MKANYKTPKHGYIFGANSGNCKQCVNKANCGQKKEGETDWCEKFRPMMSSKRRKKK